MMIMKWMTSSNERVVRLLRPLNTLDGRDAMELLKMECDGFNEEYAQIMITMKWMMSNNERVDRLLRLLNTSDGRNVIELL